MSCTRMPIKNKLQSTNKTLSILKSLDEDYEWYPTTDDMIDVIIDDIKNNSNCDCSSVIDIGAGDARVLKRFSSIVYKLYAIEKSTYHVSTYSNDIKFIGGDFLETNLINKPSDIVFCNPPYSDFVNWTNKIIKTANTTVIYLVIPTRWSNNDSILDNIKRMDYNVSVIHTSDFLTADRKARANVDIVRLVSNDNIKSTAKFNEYKKTNNIFNFNMFKNKSNSFDIWFSEMYPNMSKLNINSSDVKNRDRENIRELFKKTNKISELVSFYQRDMTKVMHNYKTLDTLDSSVFDELNIDLSLIKDTLHNKANDLCYYYWNSFFDNYEQINSRLTYKYVDLLKKSMLSNTVMLDFTELNALMITNMVIKEAIEFADSQLVDFYIDLSTPKSVQLYKSNERVFSNENWGYKNKVRNGEYSHFKLDYRIIQCGLFDITSSYSNTYIDNRKYARRIDDLLVIARLLGMPISQYVNGSSYLCDKDKDVDFGDLLEIKYIDEIANKERILCTIRVYKNGNQHVKFSQEFMLRLNVAVGKILGWVKSKNDLKDELNLSSDEFNKACDYYNVIDSANLINGINLPLLTSCK